MNIGKVLEEAKEQAWAKGLRGRAFERFVNRRVNHRLRKSGNMKGKVIINFRKDRPGSQSPGSPTYRVVFPDKHERAKQDGGTQS